MNYALLIVISYFLGAIPIGWLITKIITARLKSKDKLKNEGFFKRTITKLKNGWDIRNFGSHNPGATNVFRVLKRVPSLGITPGLVTGFVQAAMAFVVVFFIAPAFSETDNDGLYKIIAGIFCIFGNTFTVFFPSNFRGGKAVATATGAFAGLIPLPLAFAFLVWLGVLKFKGIVSYASISASFALLVGYIIYLWIDGQPVFSVENSPRTIFTIVLFGFILFTHRSNIKKALKGEENSFKKTAR